MKHLYILLIAYFALSCIVSCKTTKVTKANASTAVITSKDTLQSFVIAKTDTLSSTTNETVVACSTQVVKDETSSLLCIVLGADSTGTLKPVKGAYLRQHNKQQKDSVINDILRDCNTQQNVNSGTVTALRTHDVQQTHEEYNSQSETQKERFSLDMYISTALSLLLLLFLLYIGIRHI